MPRMISFSKYLKGKPKGRALLSYLNAPIFEELRNIPTVQFSNNGAGRTWGKVLNELGYQVDVINWDNTSFSPSHKYDLIIVHGGKNYKNLLPALKPGGKIVYYSTGSYWQYHNEQETLRFKLFAERNGVELAQDRYIGDDEEAINRKADAIISLGNKDTLATYKDFPNVYSLEGAGYLGVAPIFRNFANTRKHFLFLSGPGNIHKGLDLVIEAFRQLPDLHLHIVTVLNEDFEKFYYKDLYESSNIHTYGFVPQRSALFYAVLRQCSYSVLLSCSEGSPGSVIESIQQGMIPIVTKQSHLDLPPGGILVKDLNPPNLKELFARVAATSPAVLARRSKELVQYGKKRYAINRFEKDLANIITDITESN